MHMSDRLKFFLAHLSISAFIAVSVAAIIFCVWYPSPLATVTGVPHIFLTLLVVDVVLGPLCGLIVYKQGKKSLKFDLTVIILLQAAAFVYGFHSLAVARPAWIVFYKDSFDLIRANEIDQTHLDKVKPPFKSPSWTGPQYAAVVLSPDSQGYKQDVALELSGIALSLRPERYLPLAAVTTDIRANLKDLSILYNFNKKQHVDQILAQYPNADSWLALERGDVDRVVLMNRQQATPVQIVDLAPKDE